MQIYNSAKCETHNFRKSLVWLMHFINLPFFNKIQVLLFSTMLTSTLNFVVICGGGGNKSVWSV